MKVIREKIKKGELKGFVFLTNGVPMNKRMEIESKSKLVYDSWNRTNMLTKDDVISLKNSIEISTDHLAGNSIKFYDIEYYMENKLNEDETEWIMTYIVKKSDKIIYEGNDFESSINIKIGHKTVIDWLLGCKNVELFVLFT